MCIGSKGCCVAIDEPMEAFIPFVRACSWYMGTDNPAASRALFEALQIPAEQAGFDLNVFYEEHGGFPVEVVFPLLQGAAALVFRACQLVVAWAGGDSQDSAVVLEVARNMAVYDGPGDE